MIGRWIDGDDRSFEILYKRHIAQLTRVAMQKIDDRAMAEEIVHDAFIQLYKQKLRLPQINSLPAYLYVMIKRSLLDLYKHDQVVKKYQRYLLHHNKDQDRDTVFEHLETKELEQQLEREIQKIPPQSRTVFSMRRDHELSNREIASQLNISENTVEQHMRKALRILRAAFYSMLVFILQLSMLPF